MPVMHHCRLIETSGDRWFVINEDREIVLETGEPLAEMAALLLRRRFAGPEDRLVAYWAGEVLAAGAIGALAAEWNRRRH